jgi:hypothetical protein
VGFLLANGQTPQHRSAASKSNVPAASPISPVQAKGAANATLRNRVNVHYQLKGKTVATTAYVSKTNFLRHTLAHQVSKDVRQSRILGPIYSQATPSPSRPAPSIGFSIPQLGSCLTRINAGRMVLLVAVARFGGMPARIIVLRPPSAASILDIVIVGPACSASSVDVLFRTTIPAG